MATLKTITGKLTGPDGAGIACQVKAVLSQAVTVPGTQELVTTSARIYSDPTTGVFTLQLYANNDLTPNGTYYTVTAIGQVDNVPVVGSWIIIVPQTAGPFEISNLVTTPSPVNVPANGHVASLLVDGAVTFSAGPVSLPAQSIADAALSSKVVLTDTAQTLSGVKHFSAAPIFDAGFSVSAGLASFAAGITVSAGAVTLPARSIADGALSTNVALLNGGQTFTVAPTFSLGANFPSGAGLVFFGAGDDVSFLGQVGTAFEMDARQGTTASPILTGSGPTFKISRTEQITEASMPGGNGANNEGNAAFWASAIGNSLNEAQVSALLGTSQTSSTQNTHNDDACGIQGFGVVTGSGTGYGIGAYLEGRRTTNTGGANGAEIRSANYTATAGVYNAAGASLTMGIWATAAGNSDSAVAYVVGGGFGGAQTWKNGYAVIAGAVTDVGFRDDSSSATAFLVNGSHATAAIAVIAGAGTTVVGGTTQTQSPSIFEVQGGAADADSLVMFGSTTNTKNYSLRIRNGTGQIVYGVVGNAGAFLTGTVAGDGVIIAQTAAKSLHLGGTVKVITVTKADTLGFFAATPVGQIAGATDVLAGLVTIGLRAASSNPPLNLGTGTVTAGAAVLSKDLRRSRQTPTEAVLVSGVDATAGEEVSVTLTAARVVGAPTNPAIGQELFFVLIQNGTGGWAVTWNAAFKVTWVDTGNTLNKRSTIAFRYDGTNWNQIGAQTAYV